MYSGRRKRRFGTVLGNKDPTDDGTCMFTCLGHDDSWKPIHEYTTSETIMTNKSSIADDWQVQNCLIQNCENGLYVSSAGDTSAGSAVGLHSSSNRGWGIYDESWLGSNTYVGCDLESNFKGPYYVRATGGIDFHRWCRDLFSCYWNSLKNPF